MDLYISPLSCSLASRITVYEAGLDARVRFHAVTLMTKLIDDGGDYFGVTRKGRVPALLTDEGQLLTENAAILQFLADLAPEADLAPPTGTFARSELQQWLSYVGTELHKYLFAPQFTPDAPEEMRSYCLTKSLPPRFGHLEHVLSDGRDYLTGAQFTVADAYLFVVLCWAVHVEVDMTAYPSLMALQGRIATRPTVARALAEDMALREAATAS
ncbi:glutathione S-transferase family protein [Pseudooceanicola sp. C21-150M6]|uniref:glutathione S-transferase family protein n=1 Tax=Pseudooceanicola sp. C21-150M6 TaxID=3434355 RepID=UPI003D7FFADC